MSKFPGKLPFNTAPNTTGGLISASAQLQSFTAPIAAMVITNVIVCDSSYAQLDDAAVNYSSGYLKIVGSSFTNNTVVYINSVVVSTIFISSTEMRVVTPPKVAGVYSLTAFNNDGAGAIWAAGVTYSGIPAWTYNSYTSASAIVNTQLIATGDSALVYYLQSGSSLPPGISLSTSGLLSGTITGITANTVYTFIVLVDDAQLQTASQLITLSVLVTDPYFNRTTLLLTGEGTDNAQNNTFLDSSANNFTFTRVGTPTQGTFSPFTQNGWSCYFNGTTDYLGFSNIAFPTTFTFELWFYVISFAGTTGLALAGHIGYQPFSFNLVLANTADSISLQVTNNGSGPGSFSFPTMSNNTWYHLAVVRDIANNTTMFLNGVRSLSGIIGNGQSWSGFSTIGAREGDTGQGTADNGKFYGYMANIRILAGLAAYDPTASTITVPTANLPTLNSILPIPVQYLVVAGGGGGGSQVGGGGGAGGYLAGTLSVSQTTAITVTVGGGGGTNSNGTNSTFLSVDAVGGGGGAYMSGTRNGLSGGSGGGGSANDPTTIGSGGGGTGGQGNGGGGGSWTTVADTWWAGGGGGGIGGGGGGATTSNGTGVAGNGGAGTTSSISGVSTWYAGGGGGAGKTAMGAGGSAIGGAGGNGSAPSGTISTGSGGGGSGGGNGGTGGSGIVIIKYLDIYPAASSTTGSPTITVAGGYRTYIWTISGSITIPSYTGSATALLTLQNNYFKDNSGNNNGIGTAGTPSIQPTSQLAPTAAYSTATAGGSMYFKGSTDYLTAPSDVAFAVGTIFTVECWIYPTVAANGDIIANTAGSGGFELGYKSSTEWGIAAGGVAWRLTTTSMPTLNTWNHIAVVRAGTSTNQTTLYLNGNLLAVGTVTDAWSTTAGLTIGAYSTPAAYFSGYISNLRIAKGIAIYPSAFTSPTSPLTVTQSTTLAAIAPPSVEYLVVAGGGGGGGIGGANVGGGGGGAGGYLTAAGFVVSSGVAITVTVGGGGVINTGSGTSSIFDTVTASGGGYGGTALGASGGSGGGSGGGNFAVGAGIVGQGFAGGLGSGTWGGTTTSGGGGGGAGAVGNAATSQTAPGTGGAGKASSISGSAVTYAVGGTGGNGPSSTSGTVVAANRGNGGNGGGGVGGATPSAGGSGIVIIRYSTRYAPAPTTTNSPTMTIAGGYYIYTFTTSGSITFGNSYTAAISSSDISLLLNGTNASIYDSTSRNMVTTIGDTKVSTTQYKYGTSAMYFDGTGDYLSIPNSQNFVLGVVDFTIEMWINSTTTLTTGSTQKAIISRWNTSALEWMLDYYNGNLRWLDTNGTHTLSAPITITAGTWNHVAVVKSGTTSIIFVNGNIIAYINTQSFTAYSNPLLIGFKGDGTVEYWAGYIDDLRITKGIARYTANFVPPQNANLQ